MNPRMFSATALLVAAVSIGGCRAKSDLDPPSIILGQHECEECRMIISEERFAAAVVFESDDGTTKHAFDDIGCLIDWLQKHGGHATQATYVKDYDTAAWLNIERAFFVQSETLRTPMASHIVAVADEEAARLIEERFEGKRRSWAELSNK